MCTVHEGAVHIFKNILRNRIIICAASLLLKYSPHFYSGQWRTQGGGAVGGFKPPPEIPRALQNRAKLNQIMKTVKNCWI